jgi:hypothetical protein
MRACNQATWPPAVVPSRLIPVLNPTRGPAVRPPMLHHSRAGSADAQCPTTFTQPAVNVSTHCSGAYPSTHISINLSVALDCRLHLQRTRIRQEILQRARLRNMQSSLMHRSHAHARTMPLRQPAQCILHRQLQSAKFPSCQPRREARVHARQVTCGQHTRRQLSMFDEGSSPSLLNTSPEYGAQPSCPFRRASACRPLLQR